MLHCIHFALSSPIYHRVLKGGFQEGMYSITVVYHHGWMSPPHMSSN